MILLDFTFYFKDLYKKMNVYSLKTIQFLIKNWFKALKVFQKIENINILLVF